ncbi:hypothetical protein COW80_02390 [Candidatus Beckwithbacteria bacterium CG22_combo_CG10-13_8_21_14_all_01_47_9]|uniref:DUF5673 domain-containing protein n=5 Tax=Candidatus Beckwithiibacteriota TaxID=1752726 RepID=A0A2H0E1T9_9BACT|nr:MAG: hypothetical protein AUJ59_02720 [Candidatus Beckwithbacteria bacterium CG1_02_47_37]PIP52557.1 MAG: hypothetical protein COX09_00845 [Candidatus Beckwithbacteria bacterium CG23_combo_of_CG06-09_8_20_14_all_47_9]PIP88108.1 MAG: hypothetical protein COW80_02390 [Candidatus Beckwithbacteria bacterium CG22_combo_CG10-13_8_21_14_all_01_47_9]PJA22220.1 MAG: hypothetical protein COX59_03255 [Candidatus Beckwithbacteria bacterium CG_4_10_14_0_2_um_filter_47_25]PJC66752.1 MAG: hypothetical prot
MGLLKRNPKPQPLQETKPGPVQPVELKTLLKWMAPVRPFKKRDREYYTTIAAIVFLLAVILLFLKEWLLIAVMIALMFVAYVLATVAPESVEHELTTRGIVTGGKLYKWEDLVRFWFSHKWHDTILHLDTKLKFPGRLMLLLGDQDEVKVKEMIQTRVQYEVPAETFMDRSAKWLSAKIPLEKE